MSNPFSSLLVTPAELHSALDNHGSSRRIVPVAVGQPSHLLSYKTQHIPGSIFFDMNKIRDADSPYPQMLPSASLFADSMTELGVHTEDILVVYDAIEVGLYSSPRVAWMCRHFGQQDVHVLNNFPRYVKEEFPTSAGPFPNPQPSSEKYAVKDPEPEEVVSYDELHDLLLSNNPHPYQIIDSRIAGRFSGTEPEIDPLLRSGHMPSALNVPLASILGDDKVILSEEKLKSVFEDTGVDGRKPVILTCNSGVTAAAMDLALQLSGYKMERRLYDGSWMEWTRRAQDEGLVISST